MRIVISGASGFLGSALAAHLSDAGHDVLRLVRKRKEDTPDSIFWNPASGEIDAASLEGIDAAINLSGENLATRWTDDRKKELRESRLKSTSLLVHTMRALNKKPAVFVSASAIGIYGAERGAERLDESSAEGTDFLAQLCHEWEAAAAEATDYGVRVVNSRFGIILHPDGGALEKLITPFRFGVGGKVGSGDQWVSWIARTDIIAAIVRLLNDDSLRGPVNLTSPNPCTNEELARMLGEVLRRPAVTPVPAMVIRLALGREMADATVLASQRVMPDRLLASGFSFAYPDLEGALRHELNMKKAEAHN